MSIYLSLNACNERKRNGRGEAAFRRPARSLVPACAAALALAVSLAGCSADKRRSKQGGDDGRYMAYPSYVCVRDDNVYVGGVQFDPSEGSPFRFPLGVLWRNGQVHRRFPENGYLPANMGSVSMFVASDGSVHASGMVQRPDSPSPHPELDLVACYWKDGETHYLDVPDGGGSLLPSDLPIFVTADNDVYIAGRGNDGLLLWKNGEPSVFAAFTGTAEVASIFVSGGDVYVAGTEWDPHSANPDVNRHYAVLWVNGEKLRLSDGSDGNSIARSVFVEGGGVYVAGDDHVTSQRSDAVVWENGRKTGLTNVPESGFNSAASVFVSGGDAYVAGSLLGGYTCFLWKNGERTVLCDGDRVASAGGVFVHGGDVYVAGEIGISPVVWKNGAVQQLPFAR